MASKTSMAYHAYQAKSPMNQGKGDVLPPPDRFAI